MEIIFYSNHSTPIALDKTITYLETKDIHAKEDIETIQPKIIVTFDTVVSNVTVCDYAYIPDLGRYYFLGERIRTTGNCIKLWLKTDVLASFKAQIRSNNGIVARQENLNNAYYRDNEMPILTYSNILTRQFPKGFEANNNVILIACGGN